MKRVEDPRLIKGIATYVDDLKPPVCYTRNSSVVDTPTR